MKNFFAFACIITVLSFSIYSCEELEPFFPEGDDTVQPTFTSVGDVLDSLGELVPKQTIGFKNVEGVTFTGEGGVIIQINPNVATGLADEDSLYLVLKEYLTLDKMFYGNVQTESNGEILLTGGNFWWNLLDVDGNSVTSINPNAVQSSFTVQTDISGFESQMGYFVGQETTMGGQEVVNWNLGQGEFGFVEGQFNIFQTQLGWANCDVLYDIPAENRTQFRVGLNTSSDEIVIQNKSVFMFITDFPSLINIYTPDGDYLKTYDNTIPMGLNATLVGVATDTNGYLLIGSMDITVAGDDTFEMDVDYGTTDELQQLVEQIVQ